MITFVQTHPSITAGVVWLAIIGLFLFLLWRRNGGRSASPTLTDPEVDGVALCARMIRKGMMPRQEMRPRYLAKRHDPQRSELMAAQILADQASVQEDPGRPSHMPAPGEKGYEEPTRSFRVTVGRFTIILHRDGKVLVREPVGGWDTTEPYEVPQEWAEIVAALAFEVGKLRP